MKKYTETIKELREDNDKLQKEIADELEITVQQYSLYETGKRSLPIEHLIKLCKYYNVSADYILGTGIKEKSKKGIKINDKSSKSIKIEVGEYELLIKSIE